ncbi:MAG TPA: histidinol-phosphatase [Bacteroidales bacterium]|nr:MAG: hypothetical protein A2X11_06690 [Bacteroidetes bacterium GWE2_42_24]OFY25694.1 MAG: hypothetical protein A2X09_01915 [Bacteroidetes bacterium GWF2_43_11]PKP28070.1 MAG: histidinol-phosphatase [Bacteroidetes bacterium HGW-Bacteroidetes-22]HAQ64614.1 histidinol-phosphatase [Bacteroidales bacterium]HBZ68044.1 histidinol-phosphatase [Bacteroidales bacterium]
MVFRADLHIHTVLSPCGDLSMSPEAIIETALARNLQIIGITDHNSTLQAPLIAQIAAEKGLAVYCGAEITTREETHCLSYMPDIDSLGRLQDYIESHLLRIPNNIDKFGYQLVVDRDENIVLEYPWLLISAIDQGIDQVAAFVHSLGGLFIPAHVTRPMYSLVSQLGFIPPDLNADALELSKHTSNIAFANGLGRKNKLPVIRSSDAHFVVDIGQNFSEFEMESPSFDEFKMVLKAIGGRRIVS